MQEKQSETESESRDVLSGVAVDLGRIAAQMEAEIARDTGAAIVAADAAKPKSYQIKAQRMTIRTPFSQWGALRIDCGCGAQGWIHTAGPDPQAVNAAVGVMHQLYVANKQIVTECPRCKATQYISRPLVVEAAPAPIAKPRLVRG